MGAISHTLESAGLATTGISLVREQTERMRLPRFLWVPFELGRPFGAPNEPAFQRRVLAAALDLLERSDGPSILEDFPDDAPAAGGDTIWACPVHFATTPSDEPDLVRETRAEIRRLEPWAPPGPSSRHENSGLDRNGIVTLLGQLSAGSDVSETLGGRPLIEVTRLAIEDLRGWYLVAAARQPGRATTAERGEWLWRRTALGRLLGSVAVRLAADPDPGVRLFAARGVVPRDHFDALLSTDPTTALEPDAHDHP